MLEIYNGPHYLILAIMLDGCSREVAVVFPGDIEHTLFANRLGLASDRIIAAGECEIYNDTLDRICVDVKNDPETPEPFGPNAVSRSCDSDVILRSLTALD